MRSDLRAIILVVAAASAVVGCDMPRTVVPDPVVATYPAIDDELDFWDELAVRYVVSNDDALHGMILLAEGDTYTTYDERVAFARQRGWLPENGDAPPADESVKLGMIAVAVCEILGIEGGVTMRVFGPSPRYCTLELIYRRMIPRRGESQSITGLEFIDMIGRVQDVQARAATMAGAG